MRRKYRESGVERGPQSVKDLKSTMMQLVAGKEPGKDRASLLLHCQAYWADLAGGLASSTEPDRIDRETLVVRVSHSVYLQDFSFVKASILARLNELSQGRIRSIRTELRSNGSSEKEKKQATPADNKHNTISEAARSFLQGLRTRLDAE